MKKRKWILPVSIVGGVIVLCIAAVLIFGAVLSAKGFGISTGRLYFADNGTYLIDSDDMAMRVSDRSGDGDLFDGYQNGDRVILFHDGVNETYPAQTGGHFMFRTAKGDGAYKPADEVLCIVEEETSGDSVQLTPDDENVELDIVIEDPTSSTQANSSSSQGENLSSSGLSDGNMVSLSEKIVVNTYVLSTRHPNSLSSFTVVRTLSNKENGLLENLLREPNFLPKSEYDWVKFAPNHPNDYALAIEFMDDTWLMIALHFSSGSDTFYIATAKSDGKFDAKAGYSSLKFQRGIATEDIGIYLRNLTFNYSE